MVGTTAIVRTRQMQLPGTERGVQMLQTRYEPRIGPNRGPQVTGAVVDAVDYWLAQADLSLRREPPRVTRNHLPQSVHSSAWRLEERTVGTPQTHLRNAPLTALHAEDGHPWSDRRCRHRSVSARRALKTELCLGIGKAIWSLEVATTLVELQTRYVMRWQRLADSRQRAH